jgi:hypothetical protein
MFGGVVILRWASGAWVLASGIAVCLVGVVVFGVFLWMQLKNGSG